MVWRRVRGRHAARSSAVGLISLAIVTDITQLGDRELLATGGTTLLALRHVTQLARLNPAGR